MLCTAAVVATFEPEPGVALAAVWDGGRWATVHVVDGGAYGPVLERWDMWEPTLGGPCISCTPKAFAELVQYRVAEGAEMGDLVGLAEDYCGWSERRTDEHEHAPVGVPGFSLN